MGSFPATSPKRTGLAKAGTALLCLAIIGTIVGGFVGASSVSTAQAHHRAAVAAAKAKAADDAARASYGKEVAHVADEVLGTMQPVEQVLEGLNHPRAGVINVAQDVIVRSGASTGLSAAATDLHHIAAPPSLKTDASTLLASADSLKDSYSRLVGSVEKAHGTALVVALTSSQLDEVRTAEVGWHEALERLYGHLDAKVPAAPGSGGGWPGAHGATKASWIAGADQACATAMSLFGPDAKDLDAYASQEKHRSAAVLKMDLAVRKLALPGADADTLKTTILNHLGANDAFARQIGKLGIDASNRNAEACDADFHAMAPTFALTAPLQRGFASYGATLCGTFLQPVSPKGSGSGASSPTPSA